MKKLLILSCWLMAQSAIFAQMDVLSVTPITEKANGYYHPCFSPQGDYLLLTSANFKGLTKYDLSTRKETRLTEADNAGYEPRISAQGEVIVFRDVEYKKNLRYTSIKNINLTNGKVSQIDKPSREQYPFAFTGGNVKIAKRNSVTFKRITPEATTANEDYLVAIEDQDLVLYRNNRRIVLNPNGKGSYVWPSISPNKKQIVYMAIHKGSTTFTCNIDGSKPIALGYVASPVWFNDEWIVGMEDKDDGHQTLSSQLKAVKADGSLQQNLSTPGVTKAMYPTANGTTNSIAFESEGAIYLMKVQTR